MFLLSRKEPKPLLLVEDTLCTEQLITIYLCNLFARSPQIHSCRRDLDHCGELVTSFK